MNDSSSASNTLPVGLCGVLSRISFVRGVIGARSSSAVEPVGAVGLRAQQYRHGDGTGQRDARLVAVVHRLEHHDLVAGVEHAEQRSGERLGRAGRHDDLGVGIELDVRRIGVGGSAIAVRSTGAPRPGGYWLTPLRIASIAASSTSGGPSVSGNPWPRLIAPVCHGERRHLGEDGGAEPGEAGGQRAVDSNHDRECTRPAVRPIGPRPRGRVRGAGRGQRTRSASDSSE